MEALPTDCLAVHAELMQEIDRLEDKLRGECVAVDVEPVSLEPFDRERIKLKSRVALLEAQYSAQKALFQTLEDQCASLQESVSQLKVKLQVQAKLDPLENSDSASKWVEKDYNFDNMEELQAAVRELQQELRSTIGERAAVRSRLKQLETMLVQADGQATPKSPRSETSASSGGRAQQQMEKSGYLLKLGGQKNNKWQKRHFRMTFSKDAKCYMLQYKAADKDKTLKGSIFMPWTQVEELSEEMFGRDFCIQITPRLAEKRNKSHYFLSASSKQEQADWIRVLQRGSCYLPTAEELLECGLLRLAS